MTSTSTRKPVAPFYPPFFANFGKQSKDLLKKKYEFEHKLRTVTRARTGLTLESGAVLQDSGVLRGYLKSEFPSFAYGKLSAEVNTDAVQESKVDLRLTQLPAGLSINAGVSSKDKDRAFTTKPVGSATIEYAQQYFSSSLVVKSDLDIHKAEASVALGSDGVSVGGVIALDVSKGVEVNDQNFGVEWTQDDYTFSIFSEKNASIINGGYYQRLTPHHTLGALFKYQVSGKQERSLHIGSEYRLDADTTLKTKIELPTGEVSTHIEHRLSNPKLLVGLASSFNVKAAKFHAEKLGLALALGDF